MNESTISRTVTPSERRRNTILMDPDQVVTWLGAMRDEASADRDEAFNASDMLTANAADARCTMFARAHEDLVGLAAQNEELTKVLKRRVVVALHEAEAPPWTATHRHYKGTLYRVTGLRYDATGEELVEGIEYDDAEGRRFWISRARFESILPSGRARYELVTDGTRVE